MASVTLVRTISFGLYQRSKQAIDQYMLRVTGQSPLELASQKGQLPTLSTIACFGSAGASAGAVITFISCEYHSILGIQ
jgi:solute carrier family 25 carnitine/acylcarnitine transporter 20/29